MKNQKAKNRKTQKKTIIKITESIDGERLVMTTFAVLKQFTDAINSQIFHMQNYTQMGDKADILMDKAKKHIYDAGKIFKDLHDLTIETQVVPKVEREALDPTSVVSHNLKICGHQKTNVR